MAVATDPQKTGISSNESYSNFASFPPVGKRGLFYIDLSTNDAYLWDGSLYELSGGGGGGGVTDHGALTGLSDDDHPQYHNDTRGDVRYYTKSQVDTSLAGKLNTPTAPVSFWSQMPSFPDQLNYAIQEYDIFSGQVANFMGLLYAVSSGASSAVQPADKSESFAGINSTENAIGVCYLNTGTTSTGRAAVGLGGAQGAASLSIGQHEMIGGYRQNLAALATATENYTNWVGFMDIVTAQPTNGVYFRYNYNVNGGRWEYCTTVAGATTAADTGVSPTATVYQIMEIKITKDATPVARFYIDGTLVGTITGGLPTSTGLLFLSSCIKSAGTGVPGRVPIDALYLATERLSVR